jgi:hypothetical protein
MSVYFCKHIFRYRLSPETLDTPSYIIAETRIFDSFELINTTQTRKVARGTPKLTRPYEIIIYQLLLS